MTSKKSNTQANKKLAGKKRQIEKEREDRERGRIKRQGSSSEHRGPPKLAASVDAWQLIGRGRCYLLSTALDFLEEERMMQQSSVSISVSF